MLIQYKDGTVLTRFRINLSMLKISKLTDYAIVVMAYLAKSAEQTYSAAVIAQSVQLSVPTVSKILKILLSAQLVNSSRGMDGGYILAKRTADISLAQIIAAFEGELALTECIKVNNGCGIQFNCTLKHNWQVINEVIYSTLSHISLQAMLQPLKKSS
jgi:FeS assembly SUF system regulator